MTKRRNTLAKRVKRLETVSRPEVKHQLGESGAFDTVGSVNGTLLQPQQLQEGVISETSFDKYTHIYFLNILLLCYISKRRRYYKHFIFVILVRLLLNFVSLIFIVFE